MEIQPIPLGLSFDDVLLQPKLSNLGPEDNIETNIEIGNIVLKTPFISAAMDTVTEAQMAIAQARHGGLGIIHRNCSIEEQEEQIRLVKRHQGNMVTDPITLGPDQTIQDALAIKAKHQFTTIPIVGEFDHYQPLLGLITDRHLVDFSDHKGPLSEIMVPFKELVLAYADEVFDPLQIMKTKGKQRLPIVKSKDDHTLVGLCFKKDFQNKDLYPNMITDKDGRLRVGAAIGVGDEGRKRAIALISAGVDLLCIDTAQGHSVAVGEIVRTIKKIKSDMPIIAGNVVTKEGAKFLIDAGADAIKVGVGPGAICTTRSVTGCGSPQFSAIMQVAAACDATPIYRNDSRVFVTVIADGGIKETGDVVKAIAAGAHAVMMGSMFAGTTESPGETHEEGNMKYKVYRGMGSDEAMRDGAGIAKDRYGNSGSVVKKVAEGVSGFVPFKGPVKDVIDKFHNALIQSMRVYQGAKNIKELQTNPIFVQQTAMGRLESGIRDLYIPLTKKP